VGKDRDAADNAGVRATRGSVLPRLREAYPSVAKELLRALVPLLARVRGLAEGDARKSEILLLVALRSIEHPDFAKLDYEAIVAGQASSCPSLGTNVRSIADSAGLPRETVRRKIAQLTAAGLITGNGNSLSLSPAACLAIARLIEDMLKLAVLNHELVSRLGGPAWCAAPRP
jgi:hypothetical protein